VALFGFFGLAFTWLFSLIKFLVVLNTSGFF